MSPDKSHIILKILLQEHEQRRQDIRSMADRHVRITLIITFSVIALYGACHVETFKPFFYPLGLCGIMILVLAQLALVFNNHYFVITLLSAYTSLLEKKIQALLRFESILEYETQYGPLYFNDPLLGKVTAESSRTVRKGFWEGVKFIYEEPHWLFERMPLVPSVLLAIICFFEVQVQRDWRSIMSAYLVAGLFGLFLSAYRRKRNSLRDKLVSLEKELADKFAKNLKSLQSDGDRLEGGK